MKFRKFKWNSSKIQERPLGRCLLGALKLSQNSFQNDFKLNVRWHISKINSKEFSSWNLTARKFRKTEILSWHIPSGHKVPRTVSWSATFPRTKSLFLSLFSRSLKVIHFLGTSLILGLRRLKVLHFLGKPLLPSLKVPHFPGNISVSKPLFPVSKCYIS